MFILWVSWGHLYLWSTPFLALVSTVGKPCLVVVMVQGAPILISVKSLLTLVSAIGEQLLCLWSEGAHQ